MDLKGSLKINRPELYSLLVKKNDELCVNSKIKVDWYCSCCNEIIKNVSVISMTQRKRGCLCPLCNDGISVGEKIVYYFLKCLDIDFDFHKRFSWSNNREYDFYLPDYNTIVEVHGLQHYSASASFGAWTKKYSSNRRGRTYNEEIQNDYMKYQIANTHEITNYIIIDSSSNDFECIKKNILQSNIINYLCINVEKIDWKEIKNKTLKSFYKEIIDIWNNGEQNLIKISEKTKLCKNTVRNVLYKYNDLLITPYIPFDCKKEVFVFKDYVFIKNYKSITELCNNSCNDFGVNFCFKNVSACCLGKEYSHLGYQFSYENKLKYIPKRDLTTIYQYDYFTHQLINKYSCIQEVCKKTGIHRSSLNLMLNKKSKSCSGFIFSYHEITDFNLYKKKTDNTKRQIVQIDKNFKEIKIHKTIVDAAKSTNVKPPSISCCVRGINETSKGYYWLYLEDYELIKDNLCLYNYKSIKNKYNKGEKIYEVISIN